MPKLIKKNKGWCPICEKDTVFYSLNSWLRDHYGCYHCSSIPRERAIMHVIEFLYPNWKDLIIYESSPVNRGASLKLRNNCKNYIASYYNPDEEIGKVSSINEFLCKNENLEQQSFKDESFDLVVTQDVMEHVFHPDKAFQEIYRTLKKGGYHIFTVPLVEKNNPSYCKATISNNDVVHLYPPEYHGNPIDKNGSLVTWSWGFDIVDFIFKNNAGNSFIFNAFNKRLGIEGEFLEVCVTQKI
jgi:hypothetical protein